MLYSVPASIISFLPPVETSCFVSFENLVYSCFTDSFTVYTVIGKTSIFGDDMGITVDRLNEIAAARPADAEMFAGFTKTDLSRESFLTGNLSAQS